MTLRATCPVCGEETITCVWVSHTNYDFMGPEYSSEHERSCECDVDEDDEEEACIAAMDYRDAIAAGWVGPNDDG